MTTNRVGPVAAVLTSMSAVQLGAALSIGLFGLFGPIGTTWLRLVVASAALLLIARPWRGPRKMLLPAAGLGLMTALMMAAFSLATARIPLGAAVAVEFCGPLAVGAFHARGRTGGKAWLIWPALAAVGVLLLTHPWTEGLGTDARTLTGFALAGLAAVGWAGYIVLTAHVGRRTTGLAGLSVSITTAMLLLAPVGAVQAAPALRDLLSRGDLKPLGTIALAAFLVPLFSYILEFATLRNVPESVFGVWMALEPAIGATMGFLFLDQTLGLLALGGVALVVVAGAGAARVSSRAAGSPGPTAPPTSGPAPRSAGTRSPGAPSPSVH